MKLLKKILIPITVFLLSLNTYNNIEEPQMEVFDDTDDEDHLFI